MLGWKAGVEDGRFVCVHVNIRRVVEYIMLSCHILINLYTGIYDILMLYAWFLD